MNASPWVYVLDVVLDLASVWPQWCSPVLPLESEAWVHDNYKSKSAEERVEEMGQKEDGNFQRKINSIIHHPFPILVFLLRQVQ